MLVRSGHHFGKFCHQQQCHSWQLSPQSHTPVRVASEQTPDSPVLLAVEHAWQEFSPVLCPQLKRLDQTIPATV